MAEEKILKARLFDQPEDFKKLGINPDTVELWEESRRVPEGTRGAGEVWYFDANFDDNSKMIIGFRPTDLSVISGKLSEPKDAPNVNIRINPPDGRTLGDFHFHTSGTTATEGGCDLKYGEDWVKGDFKSYDVHFEPTNGVGLDLHFEALTEPFRQGTGIIVFGENEEIFHTDLAVPKNRVTGRLFYDNEWHTVNGVGYHDHQWMNTNHLTLYHHWFWGRMYTNNYTLYIYDFVSSKKYGYTRLPMFGLMDKEGKIVFKTDGNVELKTDLVYIDELEREFPKRSHYIFTNKDGSKVDFDVTWNQVLEVRNDYKNNGPEATQRFDLLGLKPGYMRFFAEGTIEFTDKDGKVDKSSGNMIYEYLYAGIPDPKAGV